MPIMDSTGTINPADLDSSTGHPSFAGGAKDELHRGIKRSRSPGSVGDIGGGVGDNGTSTPPRLEAIVRRAAYSIRTP